MNTFSDVIVLAKKARCKDEWRTIIIRHYLSDEQTLDTLKSNYSELELVNALFKRGNIGWLRENVKLTEFNIRNYKQDVLKNRQKLMATQSLIEEACYNPVFCYDSKTKEWYKLTDTEPFQQYFHKEWF